MTFEWLNRFHLLQKKQEQYAEKTLKAYSFGMKAKGSIVGVCIQTGPGCCDAARRLPEGQVYAPKDAPRVPLLECTQGSNCECVYRPVMKYQQRD
jgi:hypothetical protein